MKDDKNKMKHQKLLFELKYLYADLEYHGTFIELAKKDFHKAFMEDCKNEELKSILSAEHSTPAKAKPAPPEPNEINKSPDSKPQPGPEQTKEDNEEQKEELFQPKKTNSSKAVKDLYKKIVSLTHPDKLLSATEKEKKSKHALFLKATKATEENNLFELQQIALELGVELDDIDEEQVKIFEKEIEKIRKKIDNVKSTFAWVWFDTDSEESRDQIMENYSTMVLRGIKDEENK